MKNEQIPEDGSALSMQSVAMLSHIFRYGFAIPLIPIVETVTVTAVTM